MKLKHILAIAAFLPLFAMGEERPAFFDILKVGDVNNSTGANVGFQYLCGGFSIGSNKIDSEKGDSKVTPFSIFLGPIWSTEIREHMSMIIVPQLSMSNSKGDGSAQDQSFGANLSAGLSFKHVNCMIGMFNIGRSNDFALSIGFNLFRKPSSESSEGEGEQK